MLVRIFILIAALLLPVAAARAEDAPQPPALPDVVYKGLVGKALDAVPMDADQRVVLQRTNAVVSSTLTGRTLSVWAGLTNPVLLIAGVAWGVFSATNIKHDEIKLDSDTLAVAPMDAVDGEAVAVTQFFGPPAEWDTYDTTVIATLGQ